MKVKVINKSGYELPMYKTEGSAGMDLVSTVDIMLAPLNKTIIPTGIYVEIPVGYELQIRSRSGLAAGQGLVVLNSPGTIDSDYRGEIGVILYNSNNRTSIAINKGDRIAQAVLAQYERIEWVEVEELSETERGEGGFGSTGK